MNRRIRYFVLMTAAMVVALAAEITGFTLAKGVTGAEKRQKREFVAWVQLPDLSVATEARFIRFRTLADAYAPFNESPELLDYFPASFTYAPADNVAKIPSKIVLK
ncbi:hypothetical protein [Hydrogenimonas urashimensis]|uniref:hypothetical protein n=1 Tax=Hydrogenimonas urashimensis TaxID=2740515 RepID=UPI00191623DC|nr:hypothetical protein [Hydrogenimonas urashimensis]